MATKENCRFILSGELDELKLHNFLNEFIINEKPRLKKLWDYYNGKTKIGKWNYEGNWDEEKLSSKVSTNFPYLITEQYTGYNIGNGITYKVDEDTMKFLRYNDYTDKDNMMLKDALIYGKSFRLMWVDEDKKIRYDNINPVYAFEIYPDSLQTDDPVAFVRIYCEEYINILNQKWAVDVYDKYEVTTYDTDYNTLGNFSSIYFRERKPHNFNMVPVCVMHLNQEDKGIFENVVSLVDAYDVLSTAETDEYMELANAFLVVKGMDLTSDEAQKLKKQRVIQGDSVDFDIEYLTKNINDTQIQNILSNIRDNIFRISCCPDFTDQNFSNAQSGLALQYKLTGFSDVSKAIMNRMERALRRCFELYQQIVKIKTGQENFDEIEIVFKENIPINYTELAQIASMLDGKVSQRTLLTILPFVQDVEAEMEQIKAERDETYDYYGFPLNKQAGAEDEEESVLDE